MKRILSSGQAESKVRPDDAKTQLLHAMAVSHIRDSHAHIRRFLTNPFVRLD